MKKIVVFIALLLVKFHLNAQVNWKPLSTLGMGYVNGIIINPINNIKYVRTDVGGIFQYDEPNQVWINLTDKIINKKNNNVNSVEGFALDLTTSGANQVIYAICGNGNESYLLKTTNNGTTWTINQGWDSAVIYAAGNAEWRCTGEKIAVDPNNSNIVYTGTRRSGLYKTTNAATTWNKVASFTRTGGTGGYGAGNEGGISFVIFDPNSTIVVNSQTVSKNIYIGLIDGTNASNKSDVFRSNDGGVTWCSLSTPDINLTNRNPARAVFQNDKLIITAMADNDDFTVGGGIWEFEPAANVTLCSGTWRNKTPGKNNPMAGCPFYSNYLFNAVAFRPGFPNTAYTATRGTMPRKIFYTENFDVSDPTWKIITMDGPGGYGGTCAALYKPAVFTAPPTWVNIEGYDWVGNIQFDAIDNKKLWMTSGNGVITMKDVTAPTVEINATSSMNNLEILCVNDVVSPPAPNTKKAYSLVMDIMGVGYENLTNGTALKLDPTSGLQSGISFAYSFKNPNNLAMIGTFKGNPLENNGTRRMIKSNDGGTSWSNFYLPTPTCNDCPWGGNIAISATDPLNLVWAPTATSYLNGCAASSQNFPKFTKDGGLTWSTCNNINFPGNNFPLTFDSKFSVPKVLESDKVNGNIFYYYAMPRVPSNDYSCQIWRTTDGGANWAQMGVDNNLPASGGEFLKANPYVEGDIWYSPFTNYVLNNTPPNDPARKLWHSTNSGVTWSPITGVDQVYAYGFGMKEAGSPNASLIVYGLKGTVESIFVSNDLGVTFRDIGTINLPAGIIKNIEGDMKVNGQIFVSTGCRGAFFANAIITPLPLNLVLFEGKQLEGKSILNWKTTEEKLFSHFEIQKSENAQEFGTIGSTKGTNTGQYSFTDFEPNVAIDNYYRLRMVDLNGTSYFSKTVMVKFGEVGKYFSVENPSKNGEVIVNTNYENSEFTVLNEIGIKINTSQTKIEVKKYKIKLFSAKKGLYFISLNNGNDILTKKVYLD